MYNCDLTERSSGGTALLVEERPPEIREDKVLAIRQQLDEGRYGIAERLDEVVDMLVDLFGG
jgi:Anti-sigma-28 factor, FlgM